MSNHIKEDTNHWYKSGARAARRKSKDLHPELLKPEGWAYAENHAAYLKGFKETKMNMLLGADTDENT